MNNSTSFFPEDLDMKYQLMEDPLSLLFLFMWIGWTIYVFFTFFFFFKRRRSIFIYARSTYLIFFSAIGQYLMMSLYSLKMVIGPKNFPNLLDVVILWFAMPLHFLPYPLRCLRYIMLYKLGQYDGQTAHNKTSKVLNFFKRRPRFKTDSAFCILLWTLISSFVGFGLFRALNKRFGNWPGNYGTGTTYVYYFASITMFTVVSIILYIATFFMRKIQNNFKITCEFISIAIIWIVFIMPYSILGILDARNNQVPITILGIFECIISFLVSFGVPIQQAYIDKKKRTVDNKPSSRKNIFNNIDELLKDEKASAIVYNEAVKSFCHESFLFLKLVNEYKNNTSKKLFDIIMNKFVKQGSSFQVNTSHDIYKHMMQHINDANPESNVFDKIENDIAKIFRGNVLFHVSSSKQGKQYLKHLELSLLNDIDDS